MLDKQDMTVYFLVCDECGARGPVREGPGMAQSAAGAHGWTMTTAGVEHFCEECSATQAEEKGTTSPAAETNTTEAT